MAPLIEGVCLAIAIGMSNNHGVVRSVVERAVAAAVPVKADLISECNALFTGSLVKLSYIRARMTEADKALLDVNPVRYSRNSVNGTVRNSAAPEIAYGFRLEGLGAWVGESEVKTFLIAKCKLPNGMAIDRVFVNAFRNMA